MLGARTIVCALALAACANPSPKPPDRSAAPADAKPDTRSDKPELGFDLKSSLAKIADNLSKPGPYEAPEASADFDPTKPHWGVLQLHGGIVEREALSWTGGGIELRALIERLRALASDAKLTGLILRVDGIEISVPDAIELRAALHDVRKAGKRLACHAEHATNTPYLVLAACDRIALAPVGDVVIDGPAAMPVHIKGLLDKLGVQADFLHVGAYKGAAEPLTRDAPSKEMDETIGAILDRRYQTMVDAIAGDRKLPPKAVQGLIDTGLFPADQAKAEHLIDDVASFEAFRDDVRGAAPWTRLELDPDKADRLAMVMKLSRFLGAVPADRPLGSHVAVVYALGDIVDGSSGGVVGARQQIAARTLVPALHAIAIDDSVKAVVLRIDSGGGSAQASELIWRAIAELKARKPVVVSMSDVAASGGYYIASGATKIFALDDTLTGSIGVVGGKLAPRDGLARLGITTFPVGRGKRATMSHSLGPWTDDERHAIQTAMDAVYQVFVGRVAEGRHQKPEAIQKIAEGRVWTGAKAKDLGLVDAIGGLDDALAEARTLGKVDPATALEIYPPAPTLHDLVAGFGEVHAPLGLGTDAEAAVVATLRALHPAVAAATEHLVELVVSFQTSAVQAVALLPVMF
ncbi:MAG TPA: signal peptide peptidase SppA [Kofleriaceae bacterium]|jgi:protease-4|nr:signal peptide peptidase SppA [Kofleriaceae bacterium]